MIHRPTNHLPLFPATDPNAKDADGERLAGQNELVYRMLRRGPVRESDVYPIGVKRLAARIKDLRNRGIDIHTDDSGQVAVYTLGGAA